ncbi:MAG: hypothetical protein VX547_04990 [Candidatus Neomarinimicrobiota bacterium]|nr:hypothetical protein [Candidatus Neomarinimicrobiota bacterium]
MGRIKHFKAFSYIDVIYGMTVTMIIMGVVFGSIRVMEKRLRQNHLLTLADSFSNQIFEEIALRNYDENIDSIVENGLTTVFGVETGESIANWSTLDDIDDFHGQNITDNAFPGMDASVTLNYVNVNTESSAIQLSNIPTLLKRIQLVIDHPLFDNGIRYSSIIGGEFNSELLIERAYPLSISVDKTAGQHIVSIGDVLKFTVAFSDNVFLNDSDPNFSLYLDIVSGLVTGDEGSYSSRASNQTEVKAMYSGGDGTSQLTFELDIDSDKNLAGASLDDYISYRPSIVVENGSVIDDGDVEIYYVLPRVESADAFTSSTNILPLLKQWDIPIFTTAEQTQFDNNLAQQVTTMSAQDIFNNGDRFQDNDIEIEPPYTGNYNQWTLVEGENGYVEIDADVENNLGFVTTDSLENYIFEATLFSDHDEGWQDDDLIGLIIAFVRQGGKNYAIAVGKTFDGLQPKGANGTFGVFYGEVVHMFPSGNTIHSDVTLVTPGVKFLGARNHWLGKYVRIKVHRNGDDITIKMNGENASQNAALETAYIEDHTITIDLDDDLELEKFKGAKPYGYIVKSQPPSRWYDIKLSGGSLERKNVTILVQLQGGQQTAIQNYYKTNDSGNYIARDISLLQSDIGYLRPLFNSDTGNKFLLMSNGIMEYPF